MKIVAATDAAASRREAFLAACPDGRWYESVDDLLAGDKLDFVDICAPPGSHAALIERALNAGLHVLSEKPLVTQVEDAKRIAGAARRAGCVLHTVHNWLEAPICRKVSALVDGDAIGAVRSVRWRTLRTQPAIAARGRSHELAGRSREGGRRHSVRSRLARALLRYALGRHSCWRRCATRNAPLPRASVRGHGER
jgi:predicted dehydrogenase